MQNRGMAAQGTCDKLTRIYALVDPRDGRVRYVGKTVKAPRARLNCHMSFARRPGPKIRVLAWISSLIAGGMAPAIRVLEEVLPGTDWIEAEQRWIAQYRQDGADLCNLTDGGEGAPGAKWNDEQRQRALLTAKRGAGHHAYGKPMLPSVKEALRIANAKVLADPERRASRAARRLGAMSEDGRARATDALRRAGRDPECRAKADLTRLPKLQSEEARARVSCQSRQQWSEKREAIIAAQNAGKGAAWRAKQAESKRAQWADAEKRRRMLEPRGDQSAHMKAKWADPAFRIRMIEACARAALRRKAEASA